MRQIVATALISALARKVMVLSRWLSQHLGCVSLDNSRSEVPADPRKRRAILAYAERLMKQEMWQIGTPWVINSGSAFEMKI